MATSSNPPARNASQEDYALTVFKYVRNTKTLQNICGHISFSCLTCSSLKTSVKTLLIGTQCPAQHWKWHESMSVSTPYHCSWSVSPFPCSHCMTYLFGRKTEWTLWMAMWFPEGILCTLLQSWHRLRLLPEGYCLVRHRTQGREPSGKKLLYSSAKNPTVVMFKPPLWFRCCWWSMNNKLADASLCPE